MGAPELPPEIDEIELALADEPVFITVKRFGELYGCGRSHTNDLINSGELVAVQRVKGGRGSPVRILRSSVAEYMRRNLLVKR